MGAGEKVLYLSSPGESLDQHIERLLEEWQQLAPRLRRPFARIFGSAEAASKAVEVAIRFHDLGKLTSRWQEYIRKPQGNGPPHAFIGGCYLALPDEIPGLTHDAKMAAALAVSIHHTDSSLASPQLEDPAGKALAELLVDSNTGRIRWAWRAKKGSDADEAPPAWLWRDAGLPSPEEILSVDSLVEASMRMRHWARGGGLLELHKRRVMMAAIHSVLRTCDLRAARKRDSEGEIAPFVRGFLEGGWLPF